MGGSWVELLLAGASLTDLDRYRDELLGVGTSPEDVEREAGAALRVKVLLDEGRRRAAEQALLNDAAEGLAGARSTDELLPAVTGWARRLLDADLAYVGLAHDGGFVMAAAQGARTGRLQGLRLPAAAGFTGTVVAGGHPVGLRSYATEDGFPHHPAADTAAMEEDIHALLGVPLARHGRMLGALFVSRRREHRFTDREVGLLSALAAHAAAALDHAELELAVRRNERLTQALLSGGGLDALLREIGQDASGQVLFADAGDAELVERAACVRAVSAAGSVCGALVALGSRDVRADAALLERAAPFVALAVTAETAVADATRLPRDALLLDLLTRPASGPLTPRQRMRNAGLDPSASYCVLVAEPDGDPRQARREFAACGLPPGTVLAQGGTRLVALVPGTTPDDLLEHWEGRGVPAATIGVAGPATAPEHLARCHHDAELTLGALLTLGRRGQAASADRLGLYRVLLSHTGRRELRAQYEQLLGPVLREQRRRGLPLVETLQACLDHGCRATPAARALHIHVNTLYQRLAVLDELLGPDWREPPRSVDLQLLLRVHSERG
ncbi:GAF domain-containing protein [Streptomyces sp. NPDC050617]|uniref:helix-turn-helix domain-containing protein n=1 Tax=Streptomyces sp. NPDC050617 TaxID=3154628 RepID=UPI00343C7799